LHKHTFKNKRHKMEATTYVNDRIMTVSNFLSPQECKKLIQMTELQGYKPSPPSGGGHGQTGRQGARTSQFFVVDDQTFADLLWKRVRDFVPNNLRGIKPVPYMNSQTRGDEYTPVGVNDHMRYYKYDIGQHILKHDDYRMSRYRYDKKEDKFYYQMTFFTLLVYLNDEFQEGSTSFWTKYATPEGVKGSHCRFLRDDGETKFVPPDLKIKPVTGMALLNDHMVQHEGEAPAKGCKYILRTDIVHERPIESKCINDKNKILKKKTVYSDWERHYEPSCLNYSE